MPSEKIKTDILLLICTIIWGSTFVLMKIALNYADFMSFVTIRFGVATVIMAIFCIRKIMSIKLNDIKFGGMFGILLFGGIVFQVWALKYTSASNVALMYTFYIILVPFLSAFFLKKMPTISSIVGVIIATFGMYLLANESLNAKTVDIGIILALCSSICYALQIILVDRYSIRTEATLASLIQLITVTFLGVFCNFFNPMKYFIVNYNTVVIVIYTALFATALGYAVQIIFQKNTNPTHAVIIFALESVFGVIFAAIIPGVLGETEKIELSTIWGCVYLSIGFIISQFNFIEKAISVYRKIRTRHSKQIKVSR